MPQLKVERLNGKYELPDLDEDFEQLYVEGDKSLRDLARGFNIKITREYLENEPFEAEFVYDVYNAPENYSKQTVAKLKRRLQDHDIDIDDLRDDWVGHLAIKSYLNRVLDIDTSRSAEKRDPDDVLSDINGLIDYQESIMEQHLKNVNGFDFSDWNIHTEVRLIHDQTGESIRIQDKFNALENSDPK